MPTRRPCGNCSELIVGVLCPNHGFFDPIEDHYWLGTICPHCGITLQGIVHEERELREDIKETAAVRYLPDTRRDMYGG